MPYLTPGSEARPLAPPPLFVAGRVPMFTTGEIFDETLIQIFHDKEQLTFWFAWSRKATSGSSTAHDLHKTVQTLFLSHVCW
jgi:hypothetical protein